MKRQHLSIDECVARWPLLTQALQWSMVASESEAGACIRDYRDGHPYGSECVSHSGLSPADRIKFAVRQRAREAAHRYRREARFARNAAMVSGRLDRLLRWDRHLLTRSAQRAPR
jgi:hypothetical protein